MIPSRSEDPSDHEANITRLPAVISLRAWSAVASNRLTESCLRSAVNTRPSRAPMSTTTSPAPASWKAENCRVARTAN